MLRMSAAAVVLIVSVLTPAAADSVPSTVAGPEADEARPAGVVFEGGELAYTALQLGLAPGSPNTYWPAGIMVASGDGQMTARLSDHGSGAVASPDGSMIAYGIGCIPEAFDDCMDALPTLRIAGSDGSEIDFHQLRVDAGLSGGSFGWSWNATSDALVFDSGSVNGVDRGIWTMGIDGSNPRQIVNDPEAHESNPSVSQNGKYVAYAVTSYYGETELRIADTGTGSVVWSSGGWSSWLPFEWAADSLFFVSNLTPFNRTVLNVVDPPSGISVVEIQVDGSSAITDISPSPDARFDPHSYSACQGSIAYVANGALIEYPLRPPVPSEVLPASEKVEAVAWLADGRRIAYASTKTGVSHIHVVDIETGETVEIGSGAGREPIALPPETRFSDVPASHMFQADIEWLADEGITRGCNPPTNDRFCPDATVTRGQMAAFLVRALDLTARLDDPFTDDDGTTFEADIERLAAAGITRGCNPPTNDRFCPDAGVTRGQMAAFLVRALGLTDRLDDPFADDDGSTFEANIERLAAAGITRGCNPPTNDRFCPDAGVSRGQMAAFLHRALD